MAAESSVNFWAEASRSDAVSSSFCFEVAMRPASESAPFCKSSPTESSVEALAESLPDMEEIWPISVSSCGFMVLLYSSESWPTLLFDCSMRLFTLSCSACAEEASARIAFAASLSPSARAFCESAEACSCLARYCSEALSVSSVCAAASWSTCVASESN